MKGTFDATTRALILQELRTAVDLQIALWDAVQRIDDLVDCGFDPLLWIQSASAGLSSGMELGEADLAAFLDPFSERDLNRPPATLMIQ